jgi:hypothetical protein
MKFYACTMPNKTKFADLYRFLAIFSIITMSNTSIMLDIAMRDIGIMLDIIARIWSIFLSFSLEE